ncbi:DMT family transporter [Nocardioides ferulae]|uniref:DMT family transporter n=1 Tax=Nocardioides ferulae TaxID=2340821 RepID=UPI000EB14850|nr:DMT family transporter [Nocardioides ferulae]
MTTTSVPRTGATGASGELHVNKNLGFSTMVVSATLMGFVGYFARHIETTGDVIAFFRMLAGATGCFLILVFARRLPALRSVRLSPAMIVGGMALGTCLAAYVSATKYTSLANAVFLIYTGPLISAILAAIFLKEKIKPLTALFLGLVFVGMILILGLVSIDGSGVSVGLSFSGDTVKGDMLGLLSGAGYGLFLFLSRYRTDVPSDVRGFYNFVFGAVGIGIIFIFSGPSLAEMDGSSWVWLATMAALIGFGALGLLTVAGRHLTAVQLSTVSYWECVVGAGVGVVAFSESLSAMQVIGGAFIIVGGMGEVVASLRRTRGRGGLIADDPASNARTPV